jgi:hypothetical protein
MFVLQSPHKKLGRNIQRAVLVEAISPGSGFPSVKAEKKKSSLVPGESPQPPALRSLFVAFSHNTTDLIGLGSSL